MTSHAMFVYQVRIKELEEALDAERDARLRVCEIIMYEIATIRLPKL